jgi:hypothetical protein
MGMKAKAFRGEDPALATLAAQADEAALRPTLLEHELDWVAESEHGDKAWGAVLGLYDGDRLAGYVPFRYRADGLLFRMGNLRMGRLPYRILELFGCGVVAERDEVVADALTQLDEVPWPFHAVIVQEAPVDSPLWRAIGAGRARNLRTFGRDEGIHHMLDLPGSVDEYLARFSNKTRATWKRKGRKLESELGPLRLRVYTTPDEVTELLTTIEPVFRRTYHYHLLGRNLSSANEQLVTNLTRWGHKGWLRGYVLFAGEHPAAYVIGSLARGRFSYDMPGYDPDLAATSPGILLLLRMIEDLIGAGARLLDFGGGDADYKRLLATRSFPERSALLVRRSGYALGLAELQHGMSATARAASRLLERLDIKADVKRWMRGWKLRGEAA